VGWNGGFFTPDYTDLKDFTDGEKLLAGKKLARKTRISQIVLRMGTDGNSGYP
jgi:hypothetical protein